MVPEHKMCSDFIYNFCLKHFSFQKEEISEMAKNLYWPSSKLPVIFVRFGRNLYLSDFDKTCICQIWTKLVFVRFGGNSYCHFWTKLEFVRFGRHLYLPHLNEACICQIWTKFVFFIFGRHLYLSDLDETCISSAYFSKILEYKISRKSVQWEQSCSMRTDRQTERQTQRS